MKICQPHWERLKARLEELGLGHLGAKSEEDAMRNIVTELEGRSAENDYDPLMDCNNMIFTNGLNVVGLELMVSPDACPICESVKLYDQSWIDGPTHAVLLHCQELGLVEEEGESKSEETCESSV